MAPTASATSILAGVMNPQISADIASGWLRLFATLFTPSSPAPFSDSNAHAYGDRDVHELVEMCFHPDGWLRDSLTLTWDQRSLSGTRAISTYISSARNTLTLPASTEDSSTPATWIAGRVFFSPDSFELDTVELPPKVGPISPLGEYGVSFGFRFKNDVVVGRGYARLSCRLQPGTKPSDAAVVTESGQDRRQWKALTVFVSVQDLVGYEEPGTRDLSEDVDQLRTSWRAENAARVREVEGNPEVLIVGAGHSGLNLGATLQQMGMKVLIVDKHERVGDSWRLRYPTLAVHTVRSYSAMKYQPFPSNWPSYPSVDQVADFLEFYAKTQDLIVWTRSTILPKPRFNHATSTWEVFISRRGNSLTSTGATLPGSDGYTIHKLRPKHIVMATGPAHRPFVPGIPGKDLYEGMVFHATEYQGGEAFKNKNVVVVGAGNTAADICQDLHAHQARAADLSSSPTNGIVPHLTSKDSGVQSQGSITMIQRSATCVVSRAHLTSQISRNWPDTTDPEYRTDLCDFRGASIPFKLLKLWSEAANDAVKAEHKEMHDGLRKRGFKVTESLAQLVLVHERGGGFWVDVGCAELISSGKIHLKQGSQLDHFTERGLVFEDGSSLPADIVILATGYESVLAGLSETFSPEVTDRITQVGNTDEEGELAGSYRPSGHPGLWFAVCTGFMQSRSYAKQLALLMKATDLGLRS